MMQIEPGNPILKKVIKEALTIEREDEFKCSDYDNCKYSIQRNNEKQVIYFSFSCYNYKEIAEAGKNFYLKKWYSDYEVLEESPIQGYNITLVIKTDVLKDTKKKPKNVTPEEEEKIAEFNKQIKEENRNICNKISEDFSNFRRNFYGSPFENALCAIENNSEAKNTTYSTRESERIWIVTTVDEKSQNKCLSCYFALGFKDIVDRTIAKLILDEMEESKRHIKNPPAVVRSMDEKKLPDPLLESFPEFKKSNETYMNGLICISLFQKQHINNHTQKLTTFLQGFRQYLHYHIHASKSYLHSRTVKRINAFQTSLNTTKFEKDEDKYFRTLKEENKLVKAEEKLDPLQKGILKGEGQKINNTNAMFK